MDFLERLRHERRQYNTVMKNCTERLKEISDKENEVIFELPQKKTKDEQMSFNIKEHISELDVEKKEANKQYSTFLEYALVQKGRIQMIEQEQRYLSHVLEEQQKAEQAAEKEAKARQIHEKTKEDECLHSRY